MMLLVLSEWWAALDEVNKVFWGISIIFSVLFFIQFVVSLIGVSFDTDVDVDTDTDTHGGFTPDAGFTIFSVRSFIAFFTFFGWTGVMVLNNGGSSTMAVGFGALAGVLAMVIVAYIIYLFVRLQDDGSIFNAYEAIDEVGTVYLRIPAAQQGQGRIQVKLQGSIKEIEAVTRDGAVIPTGASVRIVDVLDNNILVVEPLDKYLKSGM
jgi:membrane protein implicated in regulation of membrane protease activity